MCLYVYPSLIAKQRLGKNVAAAKKTHAKVGEFLGASFSMRAVSYHREVGDSFFPELLVFSEILFLRKMVRLIFVTLRIPIKMIMRSSNC
jgi:hypothetical protein